MTDKPTIRKKGKRSGRIPRLPEHIAESGDFEVMAKDLIRRLRKRQELTTLDIVRIQTSKRWGNSFQQRALWLIENERKNAAPGAFMPTIDNLPAVERWLRDPAASSYKSAMSKRPLRPKPRKQT
ncbi:hypothetical protein [Agrobacterium sp. MCAB5]|uniref:hypothetical protein n=1 Tax=Agrobacterium sp. MCAB5 TaxID=3233042 RepID=UPI003F92E7DD